MTLTFLHSVDYRLLAIAAAFFGGIANVLARTILKDVKSKDMIGINFLIMTGTLSIFSPAFFYFEPGTLLFNIVPIAIPLIALIAGIDLAANYFYFKSFEQAEASVITPILSLSPGLVFVFSWLFLDEKVSIYNVILALGIIFGIIMVSTDFSQIKSIKSSALIPALIASTLFALSAIPSKYLLSNHLINAPTLYELRAAIIGLFSMLIFGSGLKNITDKHFRNIFIRSLFVLVQWMLLYTALASGNTGITITLSNTAPVFVLFLGLVFLKEKFSIKKLGAVILIIALSYLINISK